LYSTVTFVTAVYAAPPPQFNGHEIPTVAAEMLLLLTVTFLSLYSSIPHAMFCGGVSVSIHVPVEEILLQLITEYLIPFAIIPVYPALFILLFTIDTFFAEHRAQYPLSAGQTLRSMGR
jgi:hypothetical protein